MKPDESMRQARATRGVTSTLALAMLLASLGTSIANIALPTLGAAFGASFADVQAVVVAYLAALTITVVIAGRLGDRFGLKPMLMIGLGVFTIAALLCALAPNLWLLVGARALQGTGAAFLMTLSMALLRQNANETHVGRAMGLLGTVSALGTALGPTLGGVLLPITGWRGIFWVQLPLAIVALVLASVLLPHIAGTGKTRAPSLRSVLSWQLAPSLAINVLVAAVMMATLVVGPFYLGIGLALPATLAGFVMAIGPVVSIISGVPSGRVVDRWGSGGVLLIGLLLLAAGSISLAILPALVGVVGYGLSIMVLTPGYQLFQAANNTAVLADLPKDRRGTVSGLLSLSRNIGLMVGASVMGAVFAFGAGTTNFMQATRADIATGMRLTFLVAGALMLLAILIVVVPAKFGRGDAHRSAPR